MKNLVLATILISLSGTTLSATVNTIGLPLEMADKLANPKATTATKSAMTETKK